VSKLADCYTNQLHKLLFSLYSHLFFHLLKICFTQMLYQHQWGNSESNALLKHISCHKAHRHLLIFKVNLSSKLSNAENECLKSSSCFCTWMEHVAIYLFLPFCSPSRLLLKPPVLFAHWPSVGETHSCGTEVTNSTLALQGRKISLGLFKSLILQEVTKKGKTIPL